MDLANWFVQDGGNGEFSRLGFYYLEVRNWVKGGIFLWGRDEPTSSSCTEPSASDNWNGGNYIYGMYFTNLGDAYGTCTPDLDTCLGFGGIAACNSRNNTIRNSHFVNLVNGDPATKTHIHALYLQHHSSNNRFQSNSLSNISGDAIRVRNDSNDNDFAWNDLQYTSHLAQYGDFYQDVSGQCDDDPAAVDQECPSWRNVYRYNNEKCGYAGGFMKRFWWYGKGSQTVNRYCVPQACPDYDPNNINDHPRLETWGNTESCP